MHLDSNRSLSMFVVCAVSPESLWYRRPSSADLSRYEELSGVLSSVFRSRAISVLSSYTQKHYSRRKYSRQSCFGAPDRGVHTYLVHSFFRRIKLICNPLAFWAARGLKGLILPPPPPGFMPWPSTPHKVQHSRSSPVSIGTCLLTCSPFPRRKLRRYPIHKHTPSTSLYTRTYEYSLQSYFF